MIICKQSYSKNLLKKRVATHNNMSVWMKSNKSK